MMGSVDTALKSLHTFMEAQYPIGEYNELLEGLDQELTKVMKVNNFTSLIDLFKRVAIRYDIPMRVQYPKKS